MLHKATSLVAGEAPNKQVCLPGIARAGAGATTASGGWVSGGVAVRGVDSVGVGAGGTGVAGVVNTPNQGDARVRYNSGTGATTGQNNIHWKQSLVEDVRS